jgi:hypothetical protein
MNAIFKVGRYFYTTNGWYIYMRHGDEKIPSHVNFKDVQYYMENGIPIAGPFKSRQQMLRWFDGFVSLYSKKRNTAPYIDDKILIPETI